MLSVKDGCFQAHLLDVLAWVRPSPISHLLENLADNLCFFPIEFGCKGPMYRQAAQLQILAWLAS